MKCRELFCQGCSLCKAPKPNGGGAVLAYRTRVVFGVKPDELYDENKSNAGEGEL